MAITEIGPSGTLSVCVTQTHVLGAAARQVRPLLDKMDGAATSRNESPLPQGNAHRAGPSPALIEAMPGLESLLRRHADAFRCSKMLFYLFATCCEHGRPCDFFCSLS